MSLKLLPSAPELLTLEEAARLTGWSVSWVRARRRRGPLEPAWIEGRQAVTAESVERVRQQRAAQAGAIKTGPRLAWVNPDFEQ